MLWNARNGEVPIGNTMMSYAAFGHGKKSMILLPGLSDGLATVRGKALLLAPPYKDFFEQYRVYMFSRKDRMPEGYSIRDMAADQAKALQLLGIQKAYVCGVSQGGMIAQYLAADYGFMVEKLVLAVTAPQANDIIRDCVGRWTVYAEQGDHKKLMIDTAEKSYSPVCLKKYRRLYPVIGMVGKPKDYGRFLANARAILACDALEDIGKISCPTLIIGGGMDQIVGIEASYALKEAIPDSTLYVYEGLGHAAYEEAKDFNSRVFDFFEGN